MNKRTSWQEVGKQDVEWEFYTINLCHYGVDFVGYKKKLAQKIWKADLGLAPD